MSVSRPRERMTTVFRTPTAWFRAAAVLVVLLLPLTALTVHPASYSWSDLDPNLVYAQSGPGSVSFDSGGIELRANSSTNPALVTFASLADPTNASFGFSFQMPSSVGAHLLIGYMSPYNRTSLLLEVAGATGTATVEITDSAGTVVSSTPVGSISPASPFQVVTSFLPPQAALFELIQGSDSAQTLINDSVLISNVPANLAVELTTGGSPAAAIISSAEVTQPGSGNPQYLASSVELYAEYGLVVALSLLGFRRDISVLFRALGRRARRLLSSWVHAPRVFQWILIAAMVAVPVQVFCVTWGAQPYDLYTQELWSYLGVHSGVGSLYAISQVVPGGKGIGAASYIGSGFPYPPLPTYLFLATGGISQLVPGLSVVPSQGVGYLLKTFSVIFLDVAALVVALELRRVGVRDRWVVAGFAAIALNPALLLGSVVWGSFDVLLALFLLAFVVCLQREAWGWALFFLFIAALTKQDAVLFLPIAVPVVILRAGIVRSLLSASRALVATFFVLLPLLISGLSPAFVVNSTLGTNVLNVAATSPANIPKWQLVVSNGDYGIWPLVTAIHNGQTGIGRLQYPDYLPNQAFGLPYVDVGLGLAAAGILVLWYALWQRHRSPQFSVEWLLLLLVSFLWCIEVLTRLPARYLALGLPLNVVLWGSIRARKVGVALTVMLTVISSLSIASVLSLAAYQYPATGLGLLGNSVHFFVSNSFITGVSVVQLLTVLGAVAVLGFLVVTGRFPGEPERLQPRLEINAAKNMPSVSAIVLNYNGGDLGRGCVVSLLASSYHSLEVIVVDNDSKDDSLARMADLEKSGRIRVFRNPTNLGYSRGNNTGADLATGDLILFLNNDTRVDPGAVERMVQHFQAHPETGAAQPLILSMEDETRVANAGNELDTLGFHECFGEGDLVRSIRVRSPTGYAQGAALMIRAPLFRAVGGFDPLLRFYHTDADLSWKVWLAGYEVAVVADAHVFHAEGTSASAASLADRLFRLVHGQLVMVAKNYGAGRAIRAVVSLATIDLCISLMFLALGRSREARMVVRGLAAFLLDLPKVMLTRSAVPHFRVITDSELRRRSLRSFNPLGVFALKRRGYGYAGDRAQSQF
jgi:GT2 family glycosyltransferase